MCEMTVNEDFQVLKGLIYSQSIDHTSKDALFRCLDRLHDAATLPGHGESTSSRQSGIRGLSFQESKRSQSVGSGEQPGQGGGVSGLSGPLRGPHGEQDLRDEASDETTR